MNKTSLIIDRGSRRPRIREGQENIYPAGCYHTNYSVFEVFHLTNERIRKCREIDANLITVMPYFLLSGNRLNGFVSAVWFCSLELGKPDTQLGIKNTLGTLADANKLIDLLIEHAKDVED